MALTGLFLISFITIHLSINLLTLVSKELFNEAAHFMGTNPVIQVMQVVLALGFIIHIVQGIVISIQNRKARPVKYAYNNPKANSTWTSRNMISTGILVMLFLVLHIRDYFWEIKFNDLGGYPTDYDLVVALFANPLYTVLYVIAFIMLGLHLNHGFQSSFQSLGATHPKIADTIKKLGAAFSIIVALGFSAIAITFFVQSIMN
jgi:succinate dehydrogenase / fumarate reductase cytochrome b subunit